jgi:hypothetical protein
MQKLAFWTVSVFYANEKADRWHIKNGQLGKLKSTPYAHWLMSFKLTHKKRKVEKTLDLTSLLVCYMKHNYVIDGLKDMKKQKIQNLVSRELPRYPNKRYN